MTNKDLNLIADYFRKKYFDSIPHIDCYLVDETAFEIGSIGSFVLSKSDEYDEENDICLNDAGYNNRIEITEGLGFEYGPESWTDVLNKPDTTIVVLEDLESEPLVLIGTLLHELTHYWCWYCGYDHEDGAAQFERKLKELELPSNLEHIFNRNTKEWEDSFEYEKLEKYYDEIKALLVE